MSYTLESILTQAIDNYPATATLSPEVVAVLLYALSQIQDPYSWLDRSQDPMDEISDSDYADILELLGASNLSIISPEVGFIKPYITTNPPDNTLPCDGGVYDREDYPLLYAVLDSVFIIDADTFTLPDLSGRVLLGNGTLGAFTYSLGDTGGQNDVTLTTAEMPTHSHVADAPTVIDPTHTHAESTAIPTAITIGAGVPAPSALPSVGVTAPASTGISVLAPNIHDEGGGGAHENRQPFGVVKYCVQAR